MKQSTCWLLGALIGVAAACRRAQPVPEPLSEPVREHTMERVREPVVAGTFYPSDPEALRSQVDAMLAQAKPHGLRGLRALISPHAGYRYSGPVAASGFKQLAGQKFERVVILAPSHRVAFHGVAVADVDVFRTPLGQVRINADVKTLTRESPFILDSTPHAREHALEVQLPFLQRTLGDFELIPLVFGDVDEVGLAPQLAKLVDEHTFFVASSDLSHYYAYEQAKVLDEETVQSILRLDIEAVRHREACGKGPILALLQLAKAHGWKARLLDLRNSGDTSGDRSRVVGYAAIALLDP